MSSLQFGFCHDNPVFGGVSSMKPKANRIALGRVNADETGLCDGNEAGMIFSEEEFQGR